MAGFGILLESAGGSKRQPAAWPRLAMATPGPGLGRLQPAAVGARALLVGHGHGGAHSRTNCEGEDGEQGVEEDVEASE